MKTKRQKVYKKARNWRNAFGKRSSKWGTRKERNHIFRKGTEQERKGFFERNVQKDRIVHFPFLFTRFFQLLAMTNAKFLHKNWKTNFPSFKIFLKYSIDPMINWKVSFAMQLSYLFFVFAWLLATQKNLERNGEGTKKGIRVPFEK